MMGMGSKYGEDLEQEAMGASCTATITSQSVRRVRIVVSLVGKLVLPAVVGVYYAYLRNQKSVLESLKHQLVPAVIAFLTNSISKSLSSVQGAVTYPSIKFDPFLKIITFQFRIIPQSLDEAYDKEPEKSVNCRVLSEPPDGEEVRADIIFIHGLHGSLVKTWRQGAWKLKETHKSLQRRASTGCLADAADDTVAIKRTASMFDGDRGGEEFSGCWPKEWLPRDCPGVRVIGIGYTTDPYLWRPVWIKKRNRTSLEQRSKEMIDQLLELGVGKNPIIWVAHSKGGLFVKQMLVNSWEKNAESSIAKLHMQTKAIMFYSVPHRGSSLADFNLPFVRRSVELLEIRKDCEKVLDLHRRFLKICDDDNFKPKIFSFIETSLTFMSIVYLRIVATESADPGVGDICWVPLDHREICKPRDRNCFLYQELVELINHVS